MHVLSFLLSQQQCPAGVSCATVWLMAHVTCGSTSKPEVQLSSRPSQLLMSPWIIDLLAWLLLKTLPCVVQAVCQWCKGGLLSYLPACLLLNMVPFVPQAVCHWCRGGAGIAAAQRGGGPGPSIWLVHWRASITDWCSQGAEDVCGRCTQEWAFSFQVRVWLFVTYLLAN